MKQHNATQKKALRSAAESLYKAFLTLEKPDEVHLDRKPNPHLSFGFGPHLCLGAPHARLLLRTLLRLMCEKVGNIRLTDVKERIERAESYSRPVGFDLLRAAFSTRG